MPNGFWYASGNARFESAIPASAFSKGDLLMFTSTSSLSRVPSVATGTDTSGDIAGVATSDSNDSIDNKVGFIAPEADTLFWARWLDAQASNATPGAEGDIFFSTSSGRYFVTTASAATARVVIVRGNVGVGAVDQSVESKVLVKLIYHGGNVDLS